MQPMSHQLRLPLGDEFEHSFNQPAGWARRALRADPAARHQIRLVFVSSSSEISVTCTCMKNSSLLVASLVTAAEALRVWRLHVDES